MYVFQIMNLLCNLVAWLTQTQHILVWLVDNLVIYVGMYIRTLCLSILAFIQKSVLHANKRETHTPCLPTPHVHYYIVHTI